MAPERFALLYEARATQPLMSSCSEELEANGYTVVAGVIDATLCARIAASLSTDGMAGSRRLLQNTLVRDAVAQLRVRSPISSLLPRNAVAAQCTLFSKSDAANWSVPPHQDSSIPVMEHVKDEACKGWSLKEGLIFVQPPTELLKQLLAVRIELDGTPPPAGELCVVPGSHLLGRLSAAQASIVARRQGMRACAVPQAGALVMRPLLIHASTKAPNGIVRRVLHLLFGPSRLPHGLRWAQTV